MKEGIFMNRSAACIRMLLLLKARGFMTRQELAEALQTNVRNIPEYRKELEEAGYVIDTISGRYGGYQLATGALLPVCGLYAEEVRALHEAGEYLKSHHDFLQYPQFRSAIDKVQATTSLKNDTTGIYMEQEQSIISDKMKAMIQVCEQARKEQLALDLLYKSMNAKEVKKVRIHPYEILNYQGAYYVLAYSLKAKDYRNFKFSEERMKQVSLTKIPFKRDPEFKVADHVGKTGLMKDEIYELELLIYKESALLMSEKQIGLHPIKNWIDAQTLQYTTIMEGHMNVMMLVLSLGNQCEVIRPIELKQEIAEIAKDMLSRYSYCE